MHDTDPQRWHLAKQVSVGLIATVFLQTLGAVWWAASLNSEVDQLTHKVNTYTVEHAEENLRQWNRINTNEENTQIALSLQQTTQAILERVEIGLTETRADIKKQGELMQKYLADK